MVKWGHAGVDPAGVARAVYYVFRDETRNPGGSSIPQQLVKLTFLSPEQTISRKIREAILALEISRRIQQQLSTPLNLN